MQCKQIRTLTCFPCSRWAPTVAPLTEPTVAFDQSLLCTGLQIKNRGRTVTRTPGELTPGFAFWSESYDRGRSTWLIRVDKLQGIMFVGCLEEPLAPLHGFARNLVTPAWMLGSYGYVCTTGPHGQRPLTQAVKDELGNSTVGLLSFSSGSLVKMTLDRNLQTLEIQVVMCCCVCACLNEGVHVCVCVWVCVCVYVCIYIYIYIYIYRISSDDVLHRSSVHRHVYKLLHEAMLAHKRS